MTAPIRSGNIPLGTSLGEFIGNEIVGTTRSIRRFTTATVLGGFASLQVGGGVVFTTKAQADAHLVYDALQMALVVEDADPAKNGIYQKQGVSGSGSWIRIANLPNEMIQFTVTGGTGDVIAATMSPQIPTTQAGKLYLFTPTANNTGAVTINGVPVKSAVGSTLVSGSLLSGVPVSMIWQVDHYQLLTSLPVDASGILADAIAARDDAEDSADAATATATAVAGTIG